VRLSTVAALVLLASGIFTFAGTIPQASTTLAQQTGNNTSAAHGFQGLANGNLGAGNISKLPIRSLLYAGAQTKIYAHVLPWWGSNKHLDVGYSSVDPAEAGRQIDDMISRGIDGAIIDWYGPNTFEDRGTKVFIEQAESRPGFEVIVEIEHGAVLWSSCYPGCSSTAAVVQMATMVSQLFFSSPAYARSNGRPVVMEFGMETIPGKINWNRVAKEAPGDDIWIHRSASGFKQPKSGGAFSWLQNQAKGKKTSGWDGSPYLQSFYQAAKSAQGMLAYGSVYKGFDDSLASWSGGKQIDQDCGQTWLKTFDVINQNYSAANPLPAMQLVTWNDYEEGTALETGIDNCVKVSSQVSGGVLSWNISGGKENTIDHYAVFVSADGNNLAPLVDLEPGTSTLNLASFSLAPGDYKVYVQAVGRASIRNQMSAAASFTTAGFAGGSGTQSNESDLAVSVNPGTLKLARGKSTQTEVTLNPIKPLSGKLVLACSNLPPGVTCSFSPGIVNPGKSPASARLTVSAKSSTTAALRGQGGDLFAFAFPGVGLIGMVVVGSSRRTRALIAGALVVLCILALSGCGGGSASLLSDGTASPGTYKITVSAVSPQVQQYTTATVVIE
jgi:hypothetical protein